MRLSPRLALAALAFMLSTSSGRAGPIAVVNHSFEDPPTDRNGVGFVPGWTAAGDGSPNLGVWRPNVPGDLLAIPDGSQVIEIQNGELYQTLSAVLTANTTYELRVEVGQYYFQSLRPGQYATQLRAGGVVLASSSAARPSLGSFVTDVVTYTA